MSSEEPLTPEQEADVTALREAARALSAAHVDTLEAAEPGQHAPDQHASDQHEPGQHTPGQYAPRSDAELLAAAQRVALATALPRLAHDALVLLLDPRVDFNEDFLNRVCPMSPYVCCSLELVVYEPGLFSYCNNIIT